MKYEIISADSHIVEPPHAFAKYLDKRWVDDAPRILAGDDGGEGWSFDGKPPRRTFGIQAVTGQSLDNFKPSGLRFDEVMPGSHDGAAHIEDMAVDGVDASVIYPNAALQTFQLPDRDFAQACMRAYNDWLLTEFCAVDADRLVGLPLLPVDDGMDAAIAELRRVVGLGAKGALIPGSPAQPYHDRSYDVLWEAACELDVPLSFHRTSGGQPREDHRMDEAVAGNVSLPGMVVLYFSAVRPFTYLTLTGAFDRFPTLRLVAGEVNCGWMPFWMEITDRLYEVEQHWAKLPLERQPSEYVGVNMFVTILDDFFGFETMDERVISASMYSTDYPHSVTLWPRTRQLVPELTARLTDDDRHRVLAGNAVSVYRLDAS